MRELSQIVINSLPSGASQISSAIDASQIITASLQASLSGSNSGTLSLQASNDIVYSANLFSDQVFTNWSDIATPIAITNGATTLQLIPVCSFRAIRAQFTATTAMVQTIGLVADSSGSLNNKYFLLDDVDSAHKYYVWFNINSAGVDPAIAGRTGVPITGATNASAATLGASVATAIAALNSSNSFTTSGTSTVTVTQKVVGIAPPMVDGAAPTGFTFTVTAGAGNITVKLNAKAI